FLYLKRDQVSGVVEERREGLYEEFKEAFFKSNWTPSMDCEDDEEKSDNVDITEEKQKEGLLRTGEEVVKRRRLMDMWVQYEQEIEQLSMAIKRFKGHQDLIGDGGSEQQPLSFWEKAKLGADGGERHGIDGESSESLVFSFRFDFGEEEKEDVEAEAETES
ncbi:hypothetical protein BGZ65_000800, partial [Modicella reniformis]